MSDWKEYKLGDVCAIVGRIGFRGYTTDDLTNNPKDGAISLSPTNIVAGEIDLSKPTYIKWPKYYESPEIMLEKDDIVLVKTGSSIGRTARIREVKHPMTLNPQFVVLKKVKVDNVFLSYVLKSQPFQASLKAIIVGSAIPTLSQKNLAKISINMPEEKIQKAIARVLLALDDKIEVNRRINENLEQQAQALFKSWFVDFEPFKDQPFVDSELGMIPQGWDVKAFKDICVNITDGVHNSVKDDTNGDYYLLSCKNIKGGLITIGNNERKIDKETFEKLRNRTKLAKGDILLSSVGTIGEMVLLNENPSNFEFQRSVAIIKPNAELVSSHFLYYAMNAQKNEIIHSAHGAVQQCLFISDISNFKTILPSHEIMMNYTNVVYSFHDIISKNQQESRRLAELRDTLLPRLMSGELKVQDTDLINEMLEKGIR